jgi:hypothetical protein
MIDITNKKCIDCNITQPSFNYENENIRKYCKTCSLKYIGMIDIVNKKCVDCNIKIPSFNYENETIPLYCGDCIKNDMIDVKHKKCEKCNKIRVNDNYIYCASCDDEKRNIKKHEYRVRDVLEENNYKFYHNRRVNINGDIHYYPDFLFELKEYIIILEVDEKQHRRYCSKKELKRMADIKQKLDKKVKFIRYNPDLKGIKMEEKEEILLKTLNEWMNKSILEFNEEIVYLFYK